MSRPGKVDLNIANSAEMRSGEDYSFKFRLVDPFNKPFIFSDEDRLSARSQIRKKPSYTLVSEFTVIIHPSDHSESVTSQALVGGWIELSMPKAVVDAIDPGIYYWDLFFGGTCLLEGSIEKVFSITTEIAK